MKFHFFQAIEYNNVGAHVETRILYVFKKFSMFSKIPPKYNYYWQINSCLAHRKFFLSIFFVQCLCDSFDKVPDMQKSAFSCVEYQIKKILPRGEIWAEFPKEKKLNEINKYHNKRVKIRLFSWASALHMQCEYNDYTLFMSHIINVHSSATPAQNSYMTAKYFPTLYLSPITEVTIKKVK